MNAINSIRPAMTCDLVAPEYPADPNKGTCLCGVVEIEVTGAPLEMGYCHCSSCRSYSGNPLSTFKLFTAEQVKAHADPSSLADSPSPK